jgi:hypothetical protein
MRFLSSKQFWIGMTAASSIMAAHSALADIVISEVDASGSSNAAYGADWFELTNTGTSAVSISGWKMDDNSNSFSSAVALRGANSIAAGQSIVFLEGASTSTGDSTLDANFAAAWFGASAPAGLTFANYGGSGVGLSQNGDSVNIFNSSGTLITRVDFGAASSTGGTFDNTAGLNNVTLGTISAVGVNGAFASKVGGEIGSPGVDATPVPIPAAFLLFLSGLGFLRPAFRRRAAV